jgi:hypothetical protein
MDTKKTPKNADNFSCGKCNFICSKQSDWDRHIARPKHIRIQKSIHAAPENYKQNVCDKCGNYYKYYSGLWKHKKICTISDNITQPIIEDQTLIKTLIDENKELINDNKDFKNLILEMMKSNTDLQNKMMEVCKGSNNNNTTINNKNSHNKTFNMQIFLNEHCKDAMNIQDFADSFQLQISDLEKVGHLGYVDGISDIIIKKLNELDVYKRPIHCSDTKRDTMYVHADDVWSKETSDHDQVRMLVQRITAKNIRLLPIWREMYPNCKNNMHRLNETYLSLTRQAMGGFGGTIPENESKIIRKIAKTVYIDKNM